MDSKHIKVDRNQQIKIQNIEKQNHPCLVFRMFTTMALCPVPPSFVMVAQTYEALAAAKYRSQLG